MAKEEAQREVLNAEQFKAEVAAPKGRNPFDPINFGVQMVDHRVSDSDGDFFRMTKHIDDSIRDKIRKGEFIELEKLLAKSRDSRDKSKCIEVVNRDGNEYLVMNKDKDRENKIFGFRRWEQAFRIYAKIYSDFNPHRCGEIWQYLDTIHSASTTFHWDNVAQYDFDFRKLMAEKPARCWGTIHTQLWSLCLRDQIKTTVPVRKGEIQTTRRFTVGDTTEINVTDPRKNADTLTNALIVERAITFI